ncbi:thermonuclease family protein [Ornithinimicrobium sp. W1665]|uniref:thermonuclease family protein n=1 Tax=Ornithinimicrobium sp. W1665 TaxID=3416666 RepID=UPI003CE9C480
MKWLLGTAVLGLGVTVAVGVTANSAVDEADEVGEVVTVHRVVDGDTLDVVRDGETVRVRLLNVDTPETKHPGRAVECLGPEATAFLADRLPVGTEVELEYDQDRTDRYGRDLAGVFLDDSLVNAEIARAGLGVPVYFAPNDLFLDEVEAALEEAQAAGRGMYDPAQECTFTARAQQVEDQVAQAEETVKTDPEAGEEASDRAVESADALLLLLTDVEPDSLSAAGLTVGELDRLRQDVQGMRSRAQEVHVAAEEARELAEREKAEQEAEEKAEREREEKAAQEEAERREAADREAAERQAVQRAEADRVAAERAEAERIAAERAEAERQANSPPAPQPVPQPQPAPQPPPQPAPQPQPAPPPPPPASQPGAGYTGCRAYVGGPYVDDQGRFYTPIDCETKLPLVP